MKTKTVTTDAIGIALFAVLFLIHIPFVPNYYLCLSYIVLMVYCRYFSLWDSLIVGSAGLVIGSLLVSSYHGLPGWLSGNILITIVMHVFFNIKGKGWVKIVMEIIAGVMATAAGILLIKAGLEKFLYGVPYIERVVHNLYAFVADSMTVILGIAVSHNSSVARLVDKLQDK
mgnify:CR=1 FL=1